jgi:hypothetical protein
MRGALDEAEQMQALQSHKIFLLISASDFCKKSRLVLELNPPAISMQIGLAEVIQRPLVFSPTDLVQLATQAMSQAHMSCVLVRSAGRSFGWDFSWNSN